MYLLLRSSSLAAFCLILLLCNICPLQVEAGCLALLNVAKIEANRSSIVSEGGIDVSTQPILTIT